MKKKRVISITIVVIILIIMLIVANFNKKEKTLNNNFKILTSFYPIYIITQNITDGAKNIEVSNMSDVNVGCIHDYSLTTSNLRKFETTDVFIENGKDLETFTENIVSLYPDIKIIESAEDVSNIIEDEDEKNAHIWLSIDNYIMQINKIADKLAEANAENEAIYFDNAKEYTQKLYTLKQEYSNIKNNQEKKAVCLNEALEYLLEDLNIKGINIQSDHEQSTISAETMKEIIEKMKAENIKVIFIDKYDNKNVAELLANETNASIYTLNSAMTGNGDKDSYLDIMKENLEIIKNIDF